METTAAVLWEVGTPWSVEPILLDPPRDREVLIELRAAGMCHTEDHFATGDMALIYPLDHRCHPHQLDNHCFE